MPPLGGRSLDPLDRRRHRDGDEELDFALTWLVQLVILLADAAGRSRKGVTYRFTEYVLCRLSRYEWRRCYLMTYGETDGSPVAHQLATLSATQLDAVMYVIDADRLDVGRMVEQYWLARCFFQIAMVAALLLVMVRVHLSLGWRSYAKVCSLGFRRWMHRWLSWSNTCVRWHGLLIGLQFCLYLALFAATFRPSEHVLFWVLLLFDVAALVVVATLLRPRYVSSKGGMRDQRRRRARGQLYNRALPQLCGSGAARLVAEAFPREDIRRLQHLLVLLVITISMQLALSYRRVAYALGAAEPYDAANSLGTAPSLSTTSAAAASSTAAVASSHLLAAPLIAVDAFALVVHIMMVASLACLVGNHHAEVIAFLDGKVERRTAPLPPRVLKLIRQRRRSAPSSSSSLYRSGGRLLREEDLRVVRRGQHLHLLGADGRRQPRFFQVDDEFTQLRWSWNESLMLDEIEEVTNAAGTTSVGIAYRSAAVNINVQQSHHVTLVCRSAPDAARWAVALRGLRKLDEVSYDFDERQRARLKKAFRAAVRDASSSVLTIPQHLAFLAHLNLDLTQIRLPQIARVVSDRERAFSPAQRPHQHAGGAAAGAPVDA